MYLNYWGLKKYPFDNISDPEMYFDKHLSVDQAIEEILFSIEEGHELLSVVIGAIGIGKTMALQIAFDSLDHNNFNIAFITTPELSFDALLPVVIGQLEGKPCRESDHDKLLEIFNSVLLKTKERNKRVLLFIDEGKLLKPHNLESLRKLINTQGAQDGLLNIVLAGQPELGRRLEDPRRVNLLQRIGLYCKITGMDSQETMRSYIEHRLERSGIMQNLVIFSDDAYNIIWDNSEGGTPRIINKICQLSLKAGAKAKVNIIDADIVEEISDRFMRTYLKQHGKPWKAKTKKRLNKKSKNKEAVLAEISPPGMESSPLSKHEPTKATKGSIPDIQPVRQIVIPGDKIYNIRPRKVLSRRELEDLASKLATDRIDRHTKESDSFESWEALRKTILDSLIRHNNKGKESNMDSDS